MRAPSFLTSPRLLVVLLGTLTGCGVLADYGGEGDGGEAAVDASTEPSQLEAGTLTAGAWDDNRNFEYFTAYVEAQAQLPDAPPIDVAARATAHAAFMGERPAVGSLDVALVVDNTGSMGDEIDYLKVEFMAIASRIEAEYPGVPVRWATVAYRDEDDDFVVQSHDFTSDASDAQAQLATMAAAGGGDYPEAVADALAETNGLDWQSEGRMVFWIADAPHHPGEGASVAGSIALAKEQGIHFYPIAASDADELTELTMRSAAQLTGGRYLFLTDDSGVGGPHKEPSIPCYFVTKLDDAVVRMVGIEISGEYAEPSPEDVIRTGGDPENGACRLEDGSTVLAF